MVEIIGKTNNISFSVNILIKKEDKLFVAYCLELDIVAVAETADQAQKKIISLICAQLDYAFANNNLDNLYHPAPPEIWSDFYACKEQMERKYKIESTFSAKETTKKIFPPWLIAKTCQADNFCNV